MALAVSLSSSLLGRPTAAVGVPKKTEDSSTIQRFSAKTSAAEEKSNFEAATEVEVKESSTRSIEDRAFDRAARTLSTAANFTAVAASATNDVKRLVDSAKKLAEQIETEVDPTKRDKLAADAAELVSQIDEIGNNAEVNGFSVVDAGTQSFLFSLAPGEENSDNSFIVSVANVSISTSNLGISSLDTDSFKNNTTNTIDTLSRAQDQLQTTRASLEKSDRDIQSVAQSFGFEQQSEADEAARSKGAIDFATKLADSLTDSIATKTNNLDRNRVESLLADEEPQTKDVQSSASRRTKRDPTAPADGEVNIFDAAE